MKKLSLKSMISILYPENDYEAADIAIKAQALSRNTPIYIVPKHYGRNETDVYKNLGKTKLAIFLAFDKHKIDKKTTDELTFLVSKKIRIYSIIPDGMRPIPVILADNTELFPYPNKDKKNAIKKINEVSLQLATLQKKISPNDEVATGIAAVVLVILLLSLLSGTSKR
jgi:hypothetical protein